MMETVTLSRGHRWQLPRPGRLADYAQARLRPPRLARADVEQILRAYGLRLLSAPQNLPFGWRSHNVLLHTDAGKKVFKRYREKWPAESIRYEHSILTRLQVVDFPAPRLTLTKAGESTVQEGGHVFALFNYVEGRNYAGSWMLPAQREQLLRAAGATLARLHARLHTFLPAGEHHLGYGSASGSRQRDLAWHLERLRTLSGQVDEIEEPDVRAGARWLAQRADAIAQRLAQLDALVAAAPLPKTVIHGDYGLHNLHFHYRDLEPVTVMDFELARREWRLVDLISVLSRLGLRQGKTFVDAYESTCRAVAPELTITDDEWRLLPDVWQLYRLRGAVQYWHNYILLGDARRLSAARERVLEGGLALQKRPELWDVRHLEGARTAAVARAARPLRAMMVVRLFYPWVGGAERQAHRLAKTLLEAGTSVELVTGWWFRGTARRELVDNIPVHRNFTFWHALDIKGLRKFSGYLYVLTLVLHLWRRRRRYDVIHVHGLNYHTFAAVVAGRYLRRPVLVKLANSGPASDIKKMQQDKQLALAHRMLPWALKADCLVALNRQIVGELMAAGVSKQRIFEIPNGVDVDGFPAREAYDLHRPARLLYVGRLHEQKGLDTLLHAVHRLRQQLLGESVCLRLVGDGPERAALQTLAAQLEIADCVQFAGISGAIAAELGEADIFVLPSRAEGLSNALLEAMSCALPVVVSDVAGNVDVVRPGENGLLFPCGDARALSLALYRLLRRQTLRRQLGRAARQTVEETYSLHSVAIRYSGLYRQLAESDARSTHGEVPDYDAS